MAIIYADWPAAAHIIAGVSDRRDGSSSAPFDSQNLALHVDDQPDAVLRNRQHLDALVCEEAQPSAALQWQWLNQIHGVAVVEAQSATIDAVLDADASFSVEDNTVCTVMTADCLPILLTDEEGTAVAAIHAGWRSLCFGLIENTVQAMLEKAKGKTIMAWMGPAIGAEQFEVGEDVKQAFGQQLCGEASMSAFVPQGNGKYMADIYQLARLRLQACDVTAIYGGDFCTVSEASRFYSYRRDGQTGRMASFIVKVR